MHKCVANKDKILGEKRLYYSPHALKRSNQRSVKRLPKRLTVEEQDIVAVTRKSGTCFYSVHKTVDEQLVEFVLTPFNTSSAIVATVYPLDDVSAKMKQLKYARWEDGI